MGLSENSKKWLEAFNDPLAQLYTFGSCMATADLSGDGDHKLLIADLGTGGYSMSLKVYKGVTLIKENTMTDTPTALTPFFMDNAEPRVPAVAVASGSSLFVYKNLKPYYKFRLPSLEISETEKEIWFQVSKDQMDLTTLTELLESLRAQLTLPALAPRSQRFLLLRTVEEKQIFVESYRHETLKKASIITCITTIKKSSQDHDAIDCIVIGAENGQVHLVDSEAFTSLTTSDVPSAPVFLHASGLYDVDYRILVCSRNGCIYTLKRDVKYAAKATIELNSHAVGMTKVGKSVMIGCMDRTLRAYTLRGRRLWSLKMPEDIMTVEALEYAPKNYSACLVALGNKEVHIYQDVFLVDLLKLDDVVTGMKFGRFGREEGALILTCRSGGLSVKVFKRMAKLEEKSETPGPPAAQSQKLALPKKTKIYIDQTMRERNEAINIHHVFQSGMFLLRLNVAKNYTAMLDQKLNPIQLGSDDTLKLSAQVHGFGPTFLLKLLLQTTSLQAAIDLTLTFQFNPRLYQLDRPIIPIPMLVPGIEYDFQTRVTCLMPDKGLADDIKAFVVRVDESTPIITAVITMPVSELPVA